MAKKASRYNKKIEVKKERKEQNRIRREKFNKRERNKKIINISIISVIALAFIWFVVSSLAPEGPGEYDDFARCLTDNGVIMYGTDWCPHCQDQKQKFGSSFKYVNYINCDLNPNACDLAGVTGFPTWNFPKADAVSGSQELATLALRGNCPLES